MLELSGCDPSFFSSERLESPFLLRFTGSGDELSYLFTVAWMDTPERIHATSRVKGERIIWISDRRDSRGIIAAACESKQERASEETTAANVDDAAPADLMPDSNAEESITSEAVPTETLLEGINGNDAESSVQTEKPESVSAEKASEKAMLAEAASASEEELSAESERADASIEEVTTEPESASDARSEAVILHNFSS